MCCCDEKNICFECLPKIMSDGVTNFWTIHPKEVSLLAIPDFGSLR